MLNAAQMVLDSGIVLLSTVFKTSFPLTTYQSSNAKRCLLQMPMVSLRVKSNVDELYLMEKVDGFDYEKLVEILNKRSQHTTAAGISKEQVKQLMSITQTERERELIRYAVVKSSGVATPTAARQLFGFEDIKQRSQKVEEAIKEVYEIHQAVNEIASAQDKAILESYGVLDPSSADDISGSSDNEETDNQFDDEESSIKLDTQLPSTDSLVETLRESSFNWFAFIEIIESVLKCDYANVSHKLEDFFSMLPLIGLSDSDLALAVQSHAAFQAANNDSYEDERMVRAVNGEIVSDSESDDPEDYVGMEINRRELAVKELILKKRMAIKRRASRHQAKLVAQRRFLSRKISKQTSKILAEFPDIGKEIESYVQEHQVGADAWRRTGVLTFDGNTKLETKVTYNKIRTHLQKIYGRKFSFGTVVELCIPRNRRRRSCKRYKGLAKVTSRRARKGFNLRFNPDAHWSGCLYKGLNELQYIDGRNILVINRDDAAGFRLDTLTTCRQYATPTVAGKDPLTTRTDYVNKYASVLQTTSYNFTATRTTPEVCVGVVKAAPIHLKNPTQHFTDLMMLSRKEELQSVFKNSDTGLHKQIDCIRVDGASDEGPSHEIVQYWWTLWHFENKKVVTLVTTRCSGSSFLNRVELQNGCLSLGHANTFIPSTLGGSCVDQETGNIDETKLKRNLQLAIEAYINRVDDCPMGETTIKLYEGSTSTDYHAVTKKLEIFLKGSKKQKLLLQKEDSTLYNVFSKIWNIRNRHMVKGLPPSYIFFLKCCFEAGCEHPICSSHQHILHHWYPGGPALSEFPMPLVDESRPWGRSDCSKCPGVCTGHYSMKLTPIIANSMEGYTDPPSVILKEMFASRSEPMSNDFYEKAAKSALLSPDDAKIWMVHLETVFENRKRGAIKAAETRRRKTAVKTSQMVRQDNGKADEDNFCGKCKKEYTNESKDAEFWIGCDMCNRWYCSNCEGLSSPPQSVSYFCKTCCSS